MSSAVGPAEFESLLGPLLDSAFGFAVHLARNRVDAEDLLQEAACRAYRAYASFEPGTNFKAWFFKILTNCYAEKRRQQRRRLTTVPFDDVAELHMFVETSRCVPGSENDPANFVLSKISAEQVMEAIRALPDEYRVVATLGLVEDFSYAEIAEILKCPVGTVRSRLHRSRRMLQKPLLELARQTGVIPLRAEARP